MPGSVLLLNHHSWRNELGREGCAGSRAGWGGIGHCSGSPPAQYLGMVQVHPIHGELLGILQEVNLCFPRCHSPAGRQRGDKVARCPTTCGPAVWCLPHHQPVLSRGSPVGLVQLHNALLQLSCLVGGEAELADIVAHVLFGIIVAQLSLHSIGAQQGMRDKGAGQAPRDDVRTELQAQVVSTEGDRGLEWGRSTCPLEQAGAPWEAAVCSPPCIALHGDCHPLQPPS